VTHYQLYLVLHVGAAIAWVGSGFLLVLLGTRAALAPEHERARSYAGDAEWVGPRVFLPTNLIVLGSAFLLAEEGNWGYGALWVKLGFIGFGISFALGLGVFAPGWSRVGKLSEEQGVSQVDVSRAVHRLLVVSWFDLGILAATVFVMIVKPTGGQTKELAITAAIVAVTTLIGVALLRRRPAKQPAVGSSQEAQ
jgi:hypothetical protein